MLFIRQLHVASIKSRSASEAYFTNYSRKRTRTGNRNENACQVGGKDAGDCLDADEKKKYLIRPSEYRLINFTISARELVNDVEATDLGRDNPGPFTEFMTLDKG